MFNVYISIIHKLQIFKFVIKKAMIQNLKFKEAEYR